MRIGIDCRLWGETGVGRYIRNLVLNLQKLDNKNEYVLFVLSKDYEKFKVLASLPASPSLGGRSGQSSKFKVKVADIRWHTVEEQFKFPSIINKENLNLVHFPYFSVPIFYNRPFVVTIHDLIVNHFPTGQASTLPPPIYYLKLLAYKFVFAQAVKKARKIIAVSKATKEEIVDHLKVDEDKVVVTYEGVDDKILDSKSQIPNKSQNTKYKILNTKYFLYVGNAYPHKNLERLLEAFRLFCHPELVSGSRSNRDSDLRQNDTGLVLVGKEDYFYKRLREKVEELKLSDKIVFLQNISDEELSNLYKNALAFITPSLMEGFGLPALEAMANGCLVLASDIPSLREICGDAALYFNPLSVDELIGKLNMVTFHTTEYGRLEEIRKKSLERVKLFSWRKMAEQTLAVYEKAA